MKERGERKNEYIRIQGTIEKKAFANKDGKRVEGEGIAKHKEHDISSIATNFLWWMVSLCRSKMYQYKNAKKN